MMSLMAPQTVQEFVGRAVTALSIEASVTRTYACLIVPPAQVVSVRYKAFLRCIDRPFWAGTLAGFFSLENLSHSERLSRHKKRAQCNNPIIADGLFFHNSRCVIR